jgi:dethiobiotin synthetase
MTPRFFVTATGTSSGKTYLARGLTAKLRREGVRIAALKPLETGCDPEPLDAVALARACGRPELARDIAFYRVRSPVSPYAAMLSGAGAPDFDRIVRRLNELAADFDCTIIEGAGGLLVPLDQERDMADLAAALACPLIIAVPNRLGVLSYARTTVESARARGLRIAAVVLTEPDETPDSSSETNLRILRERLSLPLFSFPYCSNDDEALADAVGASGLSAALD